MIAERVSGWLVLADGIVAGHVVVEDGWIAAVERGRGRGRRAR